MSHSLSFDRCLPICLLMLLAALSPVATLSYDVVLAALLVACNAAPMGRELIYYPSLPVPACVCAFLSPVSLIASCDSFCIAVSVPCAPTLSVTLCSFIACYVSLCHGASASHIGVHHVQRTWKCN